MKIISKKAKNFGLALLLLVSLVLTSIPASLADDYETQAGYADCSWSLSATDVEVGDTFTATFYISTTQSTTGFTIRQILFNQTAAGLANITTNSAGTPGKSYNVSFSPTWYDGTFNDDGDLDNSTGNLTYVLTNVLAGVTGNNSAIIVNFTALNAGVMNITIPGTIWSGQAGVVVDLMTQTNWSNTSVTIYPANPTGFTATMYNHTAINLTWSTPPNPLDNVTLCGNSSGYPVNASDSVLYNGSNLTFNHTNLTNCTAYYYRVWTWNESSSMHSLLNDSATATTQCYSNFTFLGVTPTNSSTTANCTYAITPNVTIINSAGRTFLYWINGSNAQTTSGTAQAANTSISLAMTSLSHNTLYWWNVTVSETLYPGDTVTNNYAFTTGFGGGTASVAATPYPASGNSSVPTNISNFSVAVSDADSDPINTTFYWSNATAIGYQNFITSGSRAWVTPTLNLARNTTYTWYVVTYDGCQNATSSSWTFTTDEPIIQITKTMNVRTNNTIEAWINLTNNGEANFTNISVNESYHANLTFIGSTPSNNFGDTGNWTIPWLNYTGAGKWSNITIWLNLSGPVANGTSITNTGTINDSLSYSNTFTATPLTMCYYATKEANMTSLNATTVRVNFSINITNCGDFYLNHVQVNETYLGNYSYNNSNVTGNGTNETFNITQIAPGATAYMGLTLNTTFATGGGLLTNGTTVWNNITVSSNETVPETTFTNRLYVGARTTLLRMEYTTIYYDMVSLSNSLFSILGILLIIGTIMLIVGLVYFKGGIGGEGGPGGVGGWRG